jgi:hypothetical protein
VFRLAHITSLLDKLPPDTARCQFIESLRIAVDIVSFDCSCVQCHLSDISMKLLKVDSRYACFSGQALATVSWKHRVFLRLSDVERRAITATGTCCNTQNCTLSCRGVSVLHKSFTINSVFSLDFVMKKQCIFCYTENDFSYILLY